MNEIAALKNLDLNLLVSLHELSRSTSVTDAARRMGVTQSAMSHQLKRLREIFDDELFITTLRPMQPTSRASELTEPLREVLSGAAKLTRSVQPFDPTTSERRFVIASTDLSEFSMGAAARRACAASAPGVRLSFVRRPADLKQALEEGRIDVAVLPAGVPGIRELAGSYRKRLIGSDGFRVVMRPDHPAARQKLTLSRYLKLDHLLVSPSGAPGGLVDRVLQPLGKTRRVAMQVSHFVSAPFIAAATDLVLTCPAQMADEAMRHIELARFRPPLTLPKVDAYAIWHERFHEEPEHQWFRRLLFQVGSARGASAVD